MRTGNWKIFAAATVLLSGTSCTEWGQQDPPAGDSVYPSLEKVVTYTFDEEEGLSPDFRLFAHDGVSLPVIVEDAEKGKVLQLPKGSYATLDNPFNKVALQKAGCITFWMKQPVEMQEDGETPVEQDVRSSVISFNKKETAPAPEVPAGDEAEVTDETKAVGPTDAFGTFSYTANSWLKYEASDANWDENNPDQYLTGYLTPGEWHYVALMLRDDGYAVYVDGMRKTDKTVPMFDCSKIVSLINYADEFVISDPNNADSAPLLVDDITFYRNEITSKEIARPNTGNGGGGSEVDLSKWVLVGPEDNVAGFWTVWSPYVNMKGNGTIHYEFYNYTMGNNNWENWVLVLTNGIERGGDGYREFAVYRADAYGWGELYNGDNIQHNYNWDTFTSDMQGAYVSIDIVRTGTGVKFTAVTTTESGAKYEYSASIDGVDTETLGTFFTLENGHLLFNPEATFVGEVFAPGTNLLGASDYSTGWWSAHSPLNKLEGTVKNFGVEFTNHNNGSGGNWNNWLLVCTNGTWIGDPGYAEYFVLRSDAYGWGDRYESGKMTQAFEWESYVPDMSNSFHRVYFNYVGNTLTMISRANKTDGTPFPEYRFEVPELPSPVGVFFTVELAWLDITKVGYFPWVDLEPQQ